MRSARPASFRKKKTTEFKKTVDEFEKNDSLPVPLKLRNSKIIELVLLPGRMKHLVGTKTTTASSRIG